MLFSLKRTRNPHEIRPKKPLLSKSPLAGGVRISEMMQTAGTKRKPMKNSRHDATECLDIEHLAVLLKVGHTEQQLGSSKDIY